MRNETVNLLKIWCNGLISLQIHDDFNECFNGGIMCPACAGIHGRCGDAVYPMLALAKETGDEKYIEAAKLLFDWSEHNVSRKDGSYLNDTNVNWKGITVFSAVSLGEAIIHHGDLLDPETKIKWEARLKSAVEYLYYNIDKIRANINYPISCSAAMAVGFRVFNEPKYGVKARELAHYAKKFITADGLLCGESVPHDKKTAKNCSSVDLGYNVEESLGALAIYSVLTEDSEILEITEKSMTAHLNFMLPDGAWDNSWGCRSPKWTYWGSRTTDGCQIAYGLLGNKNPLFAEAARRNFLLYKECTHNGLLYGGLMVKQSNESACVHHTICHAKVLAFMLDNNFCCGEKLYLPRETQKTPVYFSSVDVVTVSADEWIGTVSGYDINPEVTPSGGCITMLWNDKIGAVAVGTMPEYYTVEPNNMSYPAEFDDICLTPCIISGEYMQNYDKTVKIQWFDSNIVTAEGILTSRSGKQGAEFKAEYSFENGMVKITSVCGENGVFRLPVVCLFDEEVEIRENRCFVHRNGGDIEIKSNSDILFEKRIFNPVGGFSAAVLTIRLEKCIPVWVTLSVNQC